MEREALKLATDGLERILGSFEKEGKFVRSSMIRNELFNEIHLLLVQVKKVLAQPTQEPVATFRLCRSCGGTGQQYTGIDESPIANCKPCNGTGQIALAQSAQKPWVSLTSEQVQECADNSYYHSAWSSEVDLALFAQNLDAALNKANT